MKTYSLYNKTYNTNISNESDQYRATLTQYVNNPGRCSHENSPDKEYLTTTNIIQRPSTRTYIDKALFQISTKNIKSNNPASSNISFSSIKNGTNSHTKCSKNVLNHYHNPCDHAYTSRDTSERSNNNKKKIKNQLSINNVSSAQTSRVMSNNNSINGINANNYSYLNRTNYNNKYSNSNSKTINAYDNSNKNLLTTTNQIKSKKNIIKRVKEENKLNAKECNPSLYKTKQQTKKQSKSPKTKTIYSNKQTTSNYLTAMSLDQDDAYKRSLLLNNFLVDKFKKKIDSKKWYTNYTNPDSNDNSMLDEINNINLFIESDKSQVVTRQKYAMFEYVKDMKKILNNVRFEDEDDKESNDNCNKDNILNSKCSDFYLKNKYLEKIIDFKLQSKSHESLYKYKN